MSKSGELQIKPGSSLDRQAKEIARLYGGICAAARTALHDAIKIGGVLLDVHESPAFKGKWLAFLAQCVPFSQPTAWRYMEYYKRREELFKLNNLSEANGLILALPEGKSRKLKRRRNKAVEELVSKGIAADEKAALKLISERSEQPDDDAGIGIVNNSEAPQRKGWQPEVLGDSDLTDEENAALAPLRAYLSDTPSGRARVVLRFVCEKLGGEL